MPEASSSQMGCVARHESQNVAHGKIPVPAASVLSREATDLTAFQTTVRLCVGLGAERARKATVQPPARHRGDGVNVTVYSMVLMLPTQSQSKVSGVSGVSGNFEHLSWK